MTNTGKSYDSWASQYDSNVNPTRDLEATALQQLLNPVKFDHCLEMGCGTGKNTIWLRDRATYIIALDFSLEMLAKAKEKIKDANVHFVVADITKDWDFTDRTYDLVCFSLILEHIENLDEIFSKTVKVLKAGGHVYIGELHPFKQYSGSKARFETEQGTEVVKCFTHHISEFTEAATKHGLELVVFDEFFDGDDRSEIPRILALLFRKPAS